MKLPETYTDVLQQVIADEDASIFSTCEFMADAWVEMGSVLTEKLKEENDWSDKEAPRRAHAWFIESSAAHAGMHPTSMYDRMRVGRNVIHRGLHKGEWENLAYGHWCALMRNVEHDGQLVIPADVLDTRLAWLAGETDAHQGQPPSVRDISDHFKRNGKKKEWVLYWESIKRNNGKLLSIKSEIPEPLRNLTFKLNDAIMRVDGQLSSTADVGSTGGGPNT